ncbi:MAG: hypothetical protein U5K37_06145 [Natrialbaceae archaeon]|nr:hypothetical protein [Natrialbaceae archaeon]
MRYSGNYRRWAFESAALDLALKQADLSLADALDRTREPVRFVVSTRLGDPPTADRVLDWLERDSSLEFKLDPTADWTPTLIETLADTDAVRIIDLKGQYEDEAVSLTGEPRLYSLLLDRFPDAVVEDPDVTPATRTVLEPETDRLSWDYPIRSVETIEALPWEPNWLNIKPSRFGTIQSLFETLEYCLERDITLYGGGQFELGPGRGQLHHLASLFYPDGPNDVAPQGYNLPDPPETVPESPLEPPATPQGFGWD